MNLDKWARLDKMASHAPANLSGCQWSGLIEFARDQIGQDATQVIYWQRKLSEYESSKAQEETRLAEQLKAPAPEIDPVKAVREELMAVFGIKEMDKPTVLLVEMLIRQISPKMFEPAQIGETDRERLDSEMISYCRHLVEQEGVKLTAAYKLTDEEFKQKPTSTQKRFDRLSKMEWANAGWGTIDGELVAVKEKHGAPKHPDVVEFLKKYHRPRK